MATILLEISITAFFLASAIAGFILGNKVRGRAGCGLNIAFAVMAAWNIAMLIGLPEAHAAIRLLAFVITAWGAVWQGSYWVGNYLETHPKAGPLFWGWLAVCVGAVYGGLQWLKSWSF